MGLPGLILAFIVGLALGALGGFLFRHAQALRETRAGQSKADMILEAAKQQGRETELRSRDEALKIRSEAEAESSPRPPPPRPPGGRKGGPRAPTPPPPHPPP